MRLSLRLVLLGLLLRPVGDWSVRPFVLLLAAVGLLMPRQLPRPYLWFSLAFLTGLRVVLDWPLSDNHAYLLCYWCLAIALALVSADARSSLAANGRLLIGAVFALAVFWKLVSPDYLDGVFFRVTLVLDDRFEGFARLAGGLSAESLQQLRDLVTQHVDDPCASGITAIVPSPRFVALAWLATYGTLLLEAAVALAFLWPLDRGPSRLRDGLLLAFCVTTYAVATVEGFGWLLVSMGLVQAAPDRARTRLFYVATFALILLYREVPWADLILRVL
jgi:hypothetical protein